jgi:hypothetical protein
MKYLLASLCILIFFSCSVQKRRYQKGFYVSHPATVPAAKKTEKTPSLPQITSAVLLADAGTALSDLALSSRPTFAQEEDSCDVILFRDGTELRAKVTEVTATEVRYKRCDNLSGPNYVSRKTDLFMIRYANGMKELMKEEAPKVKAPQQHYEEPERNHSPKGNRGSYTAPLTPNPAANSALFSGIIAILSLIFAFAVPVLLISSILSAINALRSVRKFFMQDRMEPGVYAGRGKAIAGLVLAILTLFVFLLIFLLIILLI